jgi:glycosyltransferase involved in cell wall biosynthesis
METLRILWLNHRDPKHPQAGGSEVHLWEVSKRIASYGHEVTIFSEKFEGAPAHEMLGDVEVYRAGGRVSVHSQAFLNYLGRFKQQYDLVVDDIAHAVPWFTPLYVKEPIVAVVHHIHREILDLELPFPYSRIACLAEQSIPKIYKNIPFITVSESTKKDLVNLGIPSSMIRVTYLGIDHNRYKPNWDHKAPFPYILCLGRMKRYKNIDQVLEAVKLVAEKVSDVKLSIAGRGDENIIENIKRLSRKMGLESIVEFHKEITEEEKVKFLQKAWVCVTASRREGWGLTVLEAAACGTPTVAYDVKGLRDSIINGKTGLLAHYGDREDLSKLITRVLTDDLLRKRLSQEAAEWSECFDWDKTARQTLKTFFAAANA